MKFHFLALCLLLTACQGKNSNGVLQNSGKNGVVGGEEIPYDHELTTKILSLRSDFDGDNEYEYREIQCTASAVGRRAILTAAHCIFSDAFNTEIQLRDTQGKIISVKGERAFLPANQKAGKIDLALISLREELPKDITVFAIPDFKTPLKVDKILAGGYGLDRNVEGDEGTTNVLRAVQLSVLDYDINKKIFSVDQRGGRGVCQGDSGGPALTSYNGTSYIVGVLSQTRFFRNKNGQTNFCNFEADYVNLQHPEMRLWVNTVKDYIAGRGVLHPRIVKTIALPAEEDFAEDTAK